MVARNRVRHDDKDKMYQVKGVTTRKLIKNARDGQVDPSQDIEREGGATRTNRKGNS